MYKINNLTVQFFSARNYNKTGGKYGFCMPKKKIRITNYNNPLFVSRVKKNCLTRGKNIHSLKSELK